MSTAVDWLAEWHALAVAQLDDLFGPLDIPDSVTIEPKSSEMFEAHTAESRWTLVLTAQRTEQVTQGRTTGTTVVTKRIVVIRGRNGYSTGTPLGLPYYVDRAQLIVDALAEWAAGGINTLDLGATA